LLAGVIKKARKPETTVCRGVHELVLGAFRARGSLSDFSAAGLTVHLL